MKALNREAAVADEAVFCWSDYVILLRAMKHIIKQSDYLILLREMKHIIKHVLVNT